MTFLSSEIHCSTTLAISAIDIDLVVNSLLNQGKVALTSGWEPQRFVHWLLLLWLLLLLLLLLFLHEGIEHAFDVLVTGYVEGLFSLVVGLVDIGPIGQ